MFIALWIEGLHLLFQHQSLFTMDSEYIDNCMAATSLPGGVSSLTFCGMHAVRTGLSF